MLFLKAEYCWPQSGHEPTENIQISVVSELQLGDGWRGSDHCKV